MYDHLINVEGNFSEDPSITFGQADSNVDRNCESYLKFQFDNGSCYGLTVVMDSGKEYGFGTHCAIDGGDDSKIKSISIGADHLQEATGLTTTLVELAKKMLNDDFVMLDYYQNIHGVI